MLRMIPELFSTLGELLPAWALGLIALLLAILVVPAWIRSVRAKQIRGALRRAVRVTGDAREREIRAAFDRAGDRPRSLLVLVETGLKMGLPDAWKPALRRLESRGDLLEDTARIRANLERERKESRHPVEIVVRVEELVAHGLDDLAASTLAEGLERFPEDADLLALSRRLGEPPTSE